MCGINGIVTTRERENLRDVIAVMNKSILHRGPDDSGVHVHNNRLSLGMRRLSIIDLEGGIQPIYNDSKTLVIVFNGEIYNYKEIREYLKGNGCSFTTESDTEVVLKGYEKFGIEILQRLNGMFAFAIHDLQKKKLIIVRDRVGEKPLYLYQKDDYLLFASELKSIINVLPIIKHNIPKVNKDALQYYFMLTYIPSPYCIYENIRKVKPGHYIEIDCETLLIKEINYWNIPVHDKRVETYSNYTTAVRSVRNLVYDAVSLRMISDVPIGAFLSGGVDSSIVSAVMADINANNKIDTFSVSFANKKFDESAKAIAVAKHINSNHHTVVLKHENLAEELDLILQNFDEPFADSSALPTYFISRYAKQNITVALTGDGGDESFGGYNRYLMSSIAAKYRNFVPSFLHKHFIKPCINFMHNHSDDRGTLFKIQKFINAIGDTRDDDIFNIMCMGFKRDELKYLFQSGEQFKFNHEYLSLLIECVKNLSPLQRARYLDIVISLEGDMLCKVDRASMLASLECRPPFLDHRIMEMSFQFPDSFMIKDGVKKKILKETFKDMLPDGILNFPKSGFGVPVGDWLRDHLRSDLLKLTEKKLLEKQELFNVEYINNLVGNHLDTSNDQTFKLWTLFCFQKWWVNQYS